MKLYISVGACSLASHITLIEAGAAFTTERVNRDKTTETGADYLAVNARGQTPALLLDDGAVLTEGVAIMQYVMDTAAPGVLPAPGTLGRARLQEALNYVASEVHKTYSPLFRPMSDEAKAGQMALLDQKLGWVEHWLSDGRDYLTGGQYTPADAYLFVVTGWSGRMAHDLSKFPLIVALRARVAGRPSVVAAMTAEGLI
jgi:glutathione S-transferase